MIVAALVALLVLLFAFKTLADDKTPFDYHLNYPINDATATVYKSNSPVEPPPSPSRSGSSNSAGHATRAATDPNIPALRQRLQDWGSRLAGEMDSLDVSPYWSTILAICYIEQAQCSRLPYGTNWNLWGLMYGGHLKTYSTAGDGLNAIEAFIAKAESNGRTTIESFAGWYCVDTSQPHNVCPNWQPTVLRIKAQLEAL